MSKYKKYSMLMCSVGLMLLLVGMTYSFFNYTKTGNDNTVSVGRINFVTSQNGSINLTNVFPIDSANVNTDTDNVGTVVINITGDTDLDKGIEYLVSSVDTHLTAQSGALVPLSLNITTSGIGTENSNYYDSRENTNTPIYKKLVGSELVGDQMLLVGYIVPNDPVGTANGINGSITIKAYFDKDKILISDTPEESAQVAGNRTIISTSDWSSLGTNGVSFKIKVEANEGIWVNGSLEEIMRRNAVMDNIQSTYVSASTGIDFGAISSDTNGKGVYTRAGTENDPYPIMYYRGAVEDNNVLFNNNCWKAVRTTDTGGVKLIYNGSASVKKISLPENEYTIVTNTGNFVFDSTDNAWTRTITGSDGSVGSSTLEISFKVPARDNYIMQITGITSINGLVSITIHKDAQPVNGTGHGGGGTLKFSHTYGTLTSDNVIKMTYYGNGTSESPTIIKVKMLYPNEAMGYGCDNRGTESQITLSGTNIFQFSESGLFNSPAYAGYMYGDVYTYAEDAAISGAYFGNGFEYSNGLYTLTNAKVEYDGTHHYSCNLRSIDGTCASIRYYYYPYYHITLTNGESVEDALQKMQTNTTNSNAKTQIDAWYAANMTGVTNKLEDTIWCNDRSISTKGGWDPNGNDVSGFLYYSPYNRVYNTNVPSLSCANKNDAFTVSNGNGNQKLIYPVALLTSDEVILAGGKKESSSTFYLASGAHYWSLSPLEFSYSYPDLLFVNADGRLNPTYVLNNIGLRPSISIKPGQLIVSGMGTASDPYVIE